MAHIVWGAVVAAANRARRAAAAMRVDGVAGAMRVRAPVTSRDGLAAAMHADLRNVATWAFLPRQIRAVTATKLM